MLLRLLGASAGALVGLSEPVSTGMLAAGLRALAPEPARARSRVWLVDQRSGEARGLWWSAPALARERGVDLGAVLKRREDRPDTRDNCGHAVSHSAQKLGGQVARKTNKQTNKQKLTFFLVDARDCTVQHIP